jgi:hypothetical protein
MKYLFLCLFLLSGCAAKALPMPPLETQPVQAQFGLRFNYTGMSLPLQGAVQMAENEGSMGVIFPHGQTLGVCLYRDGGMECTPAGEGGARMYFMLRQIGLAVYRILPALTQESAQDSMEADWAVRWKQTNTSRSAEYRDLVSRVAMDIHFTEVTRP